MKKIIYSTAFAFLSFANFAQNAIPNGNFESWTSGTYDVPNFFIGSNPSSFFKYNSPFNSIKTTDAYHGSYAVKLTTNVGTDTSKGYVLNATNANGGNPCQWMGGVPYTQVPTGIRGYYKSNVVAGDSAGIFVAFKHAGSCLGLYLYKFHGVHAAYTPFSFTFSPAISGTPDTMIFGAVSSDVFDKIQKNGSMFQIDSISLTGASQPANFNGDFENWTSHTVNKPNNWYLQTNDQGNGIFQTTDKKAGTYAMELKTFLGDKGNGGGPTHPVAQGAGISTGYQINNCMGPNCQRGGYPFTHQIDTLAFYYKYAPMGSDTANVNVNFKKNFNNVYGTGKFLLSASTYTYVEVPFNIGSPIDSVIVSFNSSSYRDSALSFVGSDFKVDEVHFKSQPLTTGIKTFDPSIGIKIFPNPSNDGNFVVSNVNTFDLVRVYNVFGQEVNAPVQKENDYAKIHIANPGAYFVVVNAQGKITTLKVIVEQD